MLFQMTMSIRRRNKLTGNDNVGRETEEEECEVRRCTPSCADDLEEAGSYVSHDHESHYLL